MGKVRDLLYADYLQNIGAENISFRRFCVNALKGKRGCHVYSLLLWFRLSSHRNWFVSRFARRRYWHYCKIHQIDIPFTTQIGGGLNLGHGMCIIINDKTVIGKNAHISHLVNIGSNAATSAVIGDNVYIAPMTCLVDGVKIGNNVTVGTGSVVTKDVPDNATVAGSPARILNFDNPGRFIFK